MNTKISNKWISGFLIIHGSLFMSTALTSCADFFDQESEHVIFAEKDHLNNATDSIYSVTGILSKLQAIADRTILLGEVRGDLIDVTTTANSDLRDVAQFNVGNDNQYNVPRDYYAIINNCNYFIAHADTALRNNRNEYIFMKEYAAVKAIRAWTYLQLVLNYGSVPFVTEPILTKAESEADYPRYDLQAVCDYFINDLLPLTERYGREYPGYGSIRGNDARMLWFPLNIVLGDLNLWAGSVTGNTAYYREAALRYYKYISERNGDNSTYPQGTGITTWMPGSTTWNSVLSVNRSSFASENYSTESELITMIAGDSIRAEGNYSELRNLFNSREENEYKVSLTPSQRMFDISESQYHCCLSNNGTTVLYAPQGLSRHMSGDLRLYSVFTEGFTRDKVTNERIETQSIGKYATANVHIYRRQMVYIRMAEALNMAGFPRVAFQILSTGLNNEILENEIYPRCSQADSIWISQFDFPTTRYGIYTEEDLTGVRTMSTHNTVGLHTRGSGYTPMNEYYQLPDSVELNGVNVAVPVAEQQAYVSDLLLTENALEFAFEGTRFYDLMRFALRSDNPGQFLAKRVYARRGEDASSSVQADIKKDLTDSRNWYLQWNGKIGLQ